MTKELKFCNKCVMPNTRPGIQFDEHGICEACNNYEKKKIQIGIRDIEN